METSTEDTKFQAWNGRRVTMDHTSSCQFFRGAGGPAYNDIQRANDPKTPWDVMMSWVLSHYYVRLLLALLVW